MMDRILTRHLIRLVVMLVVLIVIINQNKVNKGFIQTAMHSRSTQVVVIFGAVIVAFTLFLFGVTIYDRIKRR